MRMTAPAPVACMQVFMLHHTSALFGGKGHTNYMSEQVCSAAWDRTYVNSHVYLSFGTDYVKLFTAQRMRLRVERA